MSAKDPDDIRIRETSRGTLVAYDIDGVKLGTATRQTWANTHFWYVRVGTETDTPDHKYEAKQSLYFSALRHLRRRNTKRVPAAPIPRPRTARPAPTPQPAPAGPRPAPRTRGGWVIGEQLALFTLPA